MIGLRGCKGYINYKVSSGDDSRMLGIEGMKYISALVEYGELYINETLQENVRNGKEL